VPWLVPRADESDTSRTEVTSGDYLTDGFSGAATHPPDWRELVPLAVGLAER
jgi:hypothetical protein